MGLWATFEGSSFMFWGQKNVSASALSETFENITFTGPVSSQLCSHGSNGKFLEFFWRAKKNPKLEFLYFVFSVRNKKLVNKEVRKISILASKYTFLDLSVKERVALWCLRSSRHQASQADRQKDPGRYWWKIVYLFFIPEYINGNSKRQCTLRLGLC